jgi:very-short-patch-repair endonuclease
VRDESRQSDGKRRDHSRDEAIGALAGGQHGVVALRQLLDLGLSRAAVEGRVRRKRLLPLHRGVYAVGHPALTWRGHLVAAVLACGEGALASHRAAGALHGLVRSGRIEVTAPRERRPRPGITVHRSRLTHEDDRSLIAAVPVTSVARTLVDLADVLSEERLAKAIHQAEILRVFDLSALERAQERAGGRRGRHRLTRVLTAYRPEPHLIRSEAERRLKQLCESHSLPRPQFNVTVHGYEVDAYWPEHRLVVELDSWTHHGTRAAFERDRKRDADLHAAGITTVRFTHEQVTRREGWAASRLAPRFRGGSSSSRRSAA